MGTSSGTRDRACSSSTATGSRRATGGAQPANVERGTSARAALPIVVRSAFVRCWTRGAPLLLTCMLALGQRLRLECLELGLVDRAAVEQLLGLVDLVRRPRGLRHGLDVVVELRLGGAGLLEVPVAHVPAVGDQVDQHTEPRQDD